MGIEGGGGGIGGGGRGGGCMVVQAEGGAHKRQSVATSGVLLFKGGTGAGSRVEQSEPKQGEVWRSTHKAGHTKGGAHRRRSVATSRVLLFKGGAGAGPRGERSELRYYGIMRAEIGGGVAVHTPRGAYKRWYVANRRVLLVNAGCGAGPHVEHSELSVE